MSAYGSSTFLVVSSTPLTHEAAYLAVFATFGMLTDDFEIWVDPDVPDESVFVVHRERYLHNNAKWS